MDLVKIGFQINANGLKDANNEVDKLLNRVDKIGSGSKKNASDFENSQKRIKDSSKSTTNEVDKTTKALERQRLIGEYLAKGLDRASATAVASFKQMGGTAAQVNTLMTSLANNKGVVQAQKDTARLTREQEAQAKALERQKLIGEYLGKGLDKTTATAIANFRQLGGTISQVNTLMSSLASNKALVQAQKDAAKLTREQGAQAKAVQTNLANFKQLKAGVIDTNTVFTLLGNNHSLNKTKQQTKAVNDSLNKMRINLDLVGKGFSASEQAQLRQLKANGASNAELEKAIELIKKRKQAEVLSDYQNQKASLSREWLSAYDKEIKARVAKEKEAAAKIQQIRSDYEAKSRQSLGGGLLDQIGQKNKALSDMAKYYSNIEAQQKKAVDEQVKAQKVIALEQTKAKYIKEGYGKTDAGRLARLEVSGADVTTLNNYKDAIRATTRATQALNPVVQEATVRHSNFLGQIKGIAAYALLSTAIYGAMTATFALIGATIKMADEYTSTQQRLKLYIKDSQTLGEVNNFLAKSAIQNNVGLRENAALYAKLAPAMQRIGANTAATNMVVDAFGKSLRIGGATATEAASATIQFAQAMASGKLAGDEFRSISEASPRFLKAIADGSGIAAEKLKEMSSAGALTTEVIARALVKEYHNLTKESESLGYTLEQGTNALKTGFMSLVGEFNEGAGITKYLGSLMADLGVSMIDGAKAAKENGEAVRVWFIRNADNISTLVDAFKLLSTVIISRYVAVLVIARYESMKLTWQTSALAAAQTNAMRSFVIGATVVTAFGRAVSAAGAAFAFMGGLPGLILTVLGVVAAYAMFNKESEKTTKSLQEEGETIEEVVAKYKELTKIQQEKALLDQRKSVEESTEAYIDQKDALITAAARMKYFNEMTGFQSDVIDKLVLWYKDGKITLEQFSGAMKAQTSLTQESKDKLITLASGVSEADKKAASASKVLEALGLATKGAGNEAEIAGSKYNKFLTDAETQININKLAAQYMVKHNLDQAKAVDLAKQALALQAQKKDITPAEIKAQQELLKSEIALADITKSRTDAEKKLNKEKKDDDKDLKKFSNMKLEAQTYYDVLQKVNNLDIARIASQKEYMSIYKDNLGVANELANIQEKTRQAESRIEFEKSLREEEDSYTRIAALIKSGADYETAKAVANAKFTDDLRGREAAELSITNALTGQAYALSDQINDQETLNQYLKEGLGLEEARFKVALSRIAKLSGGKNVFGEFGEDFENSMKSLRVKRATEASQLKINSLNREAALLTTSMAFSYTAASLAAAKLSASTQGLLYSQAETQLTKQNEVDLLTEQYGISLKISSLLSQDSEVMRDIKSQYPTILGVDVQRLETARKLLEITEAYSAKQQEQKKNPFGDFSNVDFEVFGDFGNPFKEALDGLNALVGGSGQLESNLALVAAKIEDLKTQSFVEDMFGNQTAVNNITTEIEKQLGLEKDLQKQKTETIDIAYGQGLKFAKSFFKENSKGYKVVSALEMALQAKKIAFTLWEKKDTIAKYALELKGMLANAATFVSTTATKIAAQMGFNVAQAQGAVAASANAPPPVGFASAAAMIALLAGIGIAIGGGSSGSFEASNQGTGTVFGDSEAQSESIKNSIDLLSENSDLMLPLTSAMLRSLRNIESNIGGVTNLIIRQATGEGFNIQEGFNQNAIGGFLEKAGNSFFAGIGDFLGINKMLGSLLGGLFGSKTTIKGQGLFGDTQKLGDIITKGFDLFEYVDVQIKKKSFGITTSKKNKTQTSAADAALENQFTLIFSGFYDSILKASASLGANMDTVKGNLENAVIRLGKIDLKGLTGDEIQEKLEAVFGAAADELAQKGFAGLDDFQKVGEGYYETLIKVATGVEQAAYFTDRLNVTAIAYTQILNKQGDVAAEIVRQSVLLTDKTKDIAGGFYELVNNFEGTAEELTDFVLTLRDLQDQLFMTGKNADYLTSAMILGAGGLDKLSSGFDAYFEMLSPAEQVAELTRRLTKEFAIFGKELPANTIAYRDLLNSITDTELATEAGQKLYGQIIALAPEFNDLQDSIKSANSEVNALVQSLRDLAEQARAARGETEQPRNLAFLRNEFESASILAMQGDTEAANRLPTLGKDLMQVSKLYALSGSEYAKDLALIQRAATVSADVQENGLGTSISPTLTPSNATNTTPTVETTNTSTDTKLEAIREEFNAGLFAIAKYTQDMASRFERWDDGSRMIVGVQPENGDTPVPVKVVP